MQGSLFPWGRIPQEYIWGAVSDRGIARVYTHCPKIGRSGKYWTYETGKSMYIGVFDASFYGTWRDTLEKRPI